MESHAGIPQPHMIFTYTWNITTLSTSPKQDTSRQCIVLHALTLRHFLRLDVSSLYLQTKSIWLSILVVDSMLHVHAVVAVPAVVTCTMMPSHVRMLWGHVCMLWSHVHAVPAVHAVETMHAVSHRCMLCSLCMCTAMYEPKGTSMHISGNLFTMYEKFSTCMLINHIEQSPSIRTSPVTVTRSCVTCQTQASHYARSFAPLTVFVFIGECLTVVLLHR